MVQDFRMDLGMGHMRCSFAVNSFDGLEEKKISLLIDMLINFNKYYYVKNVKKFICMDLFSDKKSYLSFFFLIKMWSLNLA